MEILNSIQETNIFSNKINTIHILKIAKFSHFLFLEL